MKRSIESVGMVALCAFVGLGRSAIAQTDPLPYLWGPPEPGVSGPTFLPYASQMVRG